MTQNFITCDRDQSFLLPPSLRDWLPNDHLAWFVLEAVDELDLSDFYASYRADGGKAFLTLQRLEVTRLLRRASGASTTRIKCSIALNVERALLEHGVRCFPSLAETSTWDNVRLFHSGTATAELVDMLLYPSPETDRELADVAHQNQGQVELERQGNGRHAGVAERDSRVTGSRSPEPWDFCGSPGCGRRLTTEGRARLVR